MTAREPESSTGGGARTLVPAVRLTTRARFLVNRFLRPGVERPVFDWPDAVDGASPRPPSKGTGAYVVPGQIEINPEYRTDYLTRVSVDEAGAVTVEEVVSVNPRLMLRRLQDHRVREIELTNRWIRRMNDRATTRIVRAAEVGGRRGRMHRALGRMERRQGMRILGIVGSTLRWFVELPDRVYQRFLNAYRYLDYSLGRKELRRGISEPRVLTVEGKSVLLFLAAAAVAAAVVAVHFAVTVAVPTIAEQWREHLVLFLIGLVSAVSPFPIPFEPVMFRYASASLVVMVLVVANAVASRVVGGWMVFFVGEELNEKIDEFGRRRPWVRRTIKGLERFAARFGFWAVVLLLGIPLVPDTLVLYLFGTARLPMHIYLWGVFVGSAVRFAVLLAFATYIVRLHDVAVEWLFGLF